MIHYLCPDFNGRSGGVRVLYQHVDLLTRHGFPATIVHQNASFRAPDMPDVPVTGFASLKALGPEDFVVVPEGMAGYMAQLKSSRARRVAIALNWKFVYAALPSFVDWRAFGIESRSAAVPRRSRLCRFGNRIGVPQGRSSRAR